MLNLEINFFAFFTAGIVAFLLGIIWYHPKIMGKRWLEVRGKKPDEGMRTTPLPFMASFFLWVLTACFYSFLAQFLGINNAAGYFALACLLWVAFAMPPSLMGALYTGYPFEAVAIDTAYQLGGYYLIALVHIAFLYF
jgi:hypothetical protein